MKRLDKMKPTQEVLQEIYDLQHTNPQKRGLFDIVKEYLAIPGHTEIALSISILVLGLAAVGVGAFQLKSNLSYRQPATDVTNTAVALDYPTQPDLLGQRTKDTDHDGLSDYDELYVYGTSPYLADTDSDGVDDKTEIIRNTDPNCPYKQSCFFDATDDLTSNQTAVNYTTPAAKQSAQQLRDALVQSGVSPDDLANMSDADLAAAYQQALQQAQAPATPADVQQQISSMTPDQLRALLRQSGVSENILSSVSDTDLMALVQQTLGPTASSAPDASAASASATDSSTVSQ